MTGTVAKLPFQRLVREITSDVVGGMDNNRILPSAAAGSCHERWQASALEALQEAAEAYLICLKVCALKILALIIDTNILDQTPHAKVHEFGLAHNQEQSSIIQLSDVSVSDPVAAVAALVEQYHQQVQQGEERPLYMVEEWPWWNSWL
jgi:histone H3/H4